MSDMQPTELEISDTGSKKIRDWLKQRILLLTFSPIVVFLDQTSKWLVRKNLEYGETWTPWSWLSPYARIVHWHNTGVAFGFFQDQNLLFAFLSTVIAVVILILYPRLALTEKILGFALAMQFGGAIGNLIDRLTLGHVTDFVSVGNFAVFNIADGSISVGVVMMIIAIIIQDMRERKIQNPYV